MLKKSLALLLVLLLLLQVVSSQERLIPLEVLKNWKIELLTLNQSLTAKQNELQQLQQDLKNQNILLINQSKQLKISKDQIEFLLTQIINLRLKIKDLLKQSEISAQELTKIKKEFQELSEEWTIILNKEKKKTKFWKHAALTAIAAALVEGFIIYFTKD